MVTVCTTVDCPDAAAAAVVYVLNDIKIPAATVIAAATTTAISFYAFATVTF